jgi:tetratricopeptide (TPR) repeat protein
MSSSYNHNDNSIKDMAKAKDIIGVSQAMLSQANVLGRIRSDPIIFIQFHPILAPYLRRVRRAENNTFHQRYVEQYAILAASLYYEDSRNPLLARAIVRRELPNLRRAFDALRAQEEHAQTVEMATHIALFLNVFSLGRELADLRGKQEAAATALAASTDGTLRWAAYLHASGQGEDAYRRGDLRAAYALFSDLLARIEQQPPDAPRGPGSYEHCLTLHMLARCLEAGGQPGMAEQTLRRALAVIDALIAAAPENQNCIRQRGVLLTDLGDVLTNQGRYAEARAAYEESLEVKRTIGDERAQGVTLGQLGTLALEQRDYADAARRYTEALNLAHMLGEPGFQAIWWHQLGMVAEEQRQWGEAERCYREALTLHERQGDDAKAAATCNQLALVAKGAGRPAEAEGWYKRALALSTQVSDQVEQARNLNNLANLLKDEIRAERMGRTRLAEARGYAEQALAIKETLDLSAQSWAPLGILAQLAELAGQSEQAAAYRRRERETFAQFAGNRYHIDQQHGALIAAIAAVARGDEAKRAAVEEVLPQLESNGWRIADAVRRIWQGERDWHALCEGIDCNSALLILSMLEVLAGAAVPEAAGADDQATRILQQAEPLLQAVATIAAGDTSQQQAVEEELARLEEKDFHLREAVQRIWAGERDAAALTAGLDAIDSALVRRVLEVIGEGRVDDVSQ